MPGGLSELPLEFPCQMHAIDKPAVDGNFKHGKLRFPQQEGRVMQPEIAEECRWRQAQLILEAPLKLAGSSRDAWLARRGSASIAPSSPP